MGMVACIMWKTYLQYVLMGLGILFLGLVFYLAYLQVFSKPVPNTQNITALPGSVLNVTNKEETIIDKKSWAIGPEILTNFKETYVGVICLYQF